MRVVGKRVVGVRVGGAGVPVGGERVFGVRVGGVLVAALLAAAACSGGGETAAEVQGDDPSSAEDGSERGDAREGARTGGEHGSTDDERSGEGSEGAERPEGGDGDGVDEGDGPGLPATGATASGDEGADADEDADDEQAQESDEGIAPDERPLPTGAQELAAAINEAELALRRPGVDQESAAPWGRRQQALYRVLAFNPEWADEVLAAAEPSVAEAVALNWTGRQELLALVHTEELTETLPAWRIAAPAPADELLEHYAEAEAATGVPWEILASINLVETRMGRIQGISSAGAIGPMQFLPTTWAECCDGDPTVPRDAINGAATYLIQRGAANDLDRAIFGYNNSDYYVTAITAYAEVMMADRSAYYGYHAWEVYYLSAEGLIVLPEGYEQPEPIEAAEWLTANPETRFPR